MSRPRHAAPTSGSMHPRRRAPATRESRRAATPTEKNRAGNIAFGARRLHAPRSVAEIQEIVASGTTAGTTVRALGTRHSFSTVADTAGDLVSLAGLDRVVEIDRAAGSVTVGAGLRFGEFADVLHENGYALRDLGSQRGGQRPSRSFR
ncbi:FAD-binding protein [Streptomyces sp. NPDC048496]|uniref:FAD-binding protein n=1 Tax=Streptomyces sp. NPDC048496 TaxID=3365558 RepID=UPI00371D69C2